MSFTTGTVKRQGPHQGAEKNTSWIGFVEVAALLFKIILAKSSTVVIAIPPLFAIIFSLELYDTTSLRLNILLAFLTMVQPLLDGCANRTWHEFEENPCVVSSWHVMAITTRIRQYNLPIASDPDWVLARHRQIIRTLGALFQGQTGCQGITPCKSRFDIWEEWLYTQVWVTSTLVS